MTDEIGEALNIKPARGTLIAGIDDKGPAKAAGIETGDVILKFDGKDIKETRDLTRMVADTPVDKEVEVVIIRKGKEEKKTVKVGRLEDTDKKLASVKPNAPAEKPVEVKKALGLDLADINDDLRKKYNIKDNVKGAVVTAVEQNSPAAEKQMKPGDTIVEISQVTVANAGRRAEARRSAQEGRAQVGAVPGRQCGRRDAVRRAESAVVSLVMPGLDPGIHLKRFGYEDDGSPGRARRCEQRFSGAYPSTNSSFL